jgi:hypothetical protein
MRPMSWFYERSGESIGPVTEAEFSRLVADGSIGPATLVWREGMTNWQPQAELLPPAVPSVAPSIVTGPAPGAATSSCQVCGGVFPADQMVAIAGATVCAACKPARLQMLHEGVAPAAAGVWRRGNSLVMTRGAHLPDRCIRCNTASNLRRIKRTLHWHHPAIYLTILAGLLVYVIVALVVRKRAEVEVSICPADLTSRRVKIALAWLFWLSFFGSFMVLASLQAPDWMWAVVPPVLLIIGLIFTIMSRLVKPAKIDEKQVWLRGICAPYLAALPEWPGP